MTEPVVFNGWCLVSVLATAAAGLLTTWLFGRWAMPWLDRYCREPLKAPSANVRRLRQAKASTPTMGGLFILAAWLLVVVVALWVHDRLSIGVGIAVALVCGLALLGACDDWLKVHTSRAGLRPRSKLLVQCLLAAIAVWMLRQYAGWLSQDGRLTVPLIAYDLSLGNFYAPLAVLMIVASSNAANLTDGLDGLASGCLALALGAYAVVALFGSHSAEPWSLVASSMAAAGCGVMIGFLRFNRHPARVFMGDTGALPMGGLLAIVALFSRQELLLAVVGGVFLVETLSVVIQVASYRLTGRRVFRCAPLHHHFQLLGWSEPSTVRRFCMAGAVCVCAALALFAVQHASRTTSWQSLLAETSGGMAIVNERLE